MFNEVNELLRRTIKSEDNEIYEIRNENNIPKRILQKLKQLIS